MKDLSAHDFKILANVLCHPTTQAMLDTMELLECDPELAIGKNPDSGNVYVAFEGGYVAYSAGINKSTLFSKYDYEKEEETDLTVDDMEEVISMFGGVS